MFDATRFSFRAQSPWDIIHQQRAVVDGVHPLDGWRHKRCGPPATPVSVVRKDDIGVTVVIVDYPSSVGQLYLVTTYWNAKPEEVLEVVQEKRKFLDLTQPFEWSGGPEEMDGSKLFYYLANGAK